MEPITKIAWETKNQWLDNPEFYDKTKYCLSLKTKKQTKNSDEMTPNNILLHTYISPVIINRSSSYNRE